jgi:hypothetical protein
VSCTVWPTVSDCVVGVTARESTSEFVQPAKGRKRAIRRSARGEKRSCIVDLRNLQPVLKSVQQHQGRLSPASTPFNICHRISTLYCTKVLLRLFAPRQSISPLSRLQTDVTNVMADQFSDRKNGPRGELKSPARGPSIDFYCGCSTRERSPSR